MSIQNSDWCSALSEHCDRVSDQVGGMFGMKGSMHHLADHQWRAEPTDAGFDGRSAFGLGQTIASALKGHVQEATVLELAKHCRDLLAAHLSQVSARKVNFLVRQDNGDVAHA